MASPWNEVDHFWKKTAWHLRQLSEPASIAVRTQGAEAGDAGVVRRGMTTHAATPSATTLDAAPKIRLRLQDDATGGLRWADRSTSRRASRMGRLDQAKRLTAGRTAGIASVAGTSTIREPYDRKLFVSRLGDKVTSKGFQVFVSLLLTTPRRTETQ
jgi:hypothetical protein